MFNCPSIDTWEFYTFSTALQCHISGFAGALMDKWQSQSSKQNTLTHAYLRCKQVAHGFPRSEIDRKSTEFLLDLYTQKSSKSSQQKSNENHKNRNLVELFVCCFRRSTEHPRPRNQTSIPAKTYVQKDGQQISEEDH